MTASRKGARIQALLAYVREHPGCVAIDAVRACGAKERDGYASVHRAVAAGWLTVAHEPRTDQRGGLGCGRALMRLWVA